MRLHYLAAHQLSGMLVRREISAEELTAKVLSRMDALEDKIGAYITITKEQALKQAREVDQARAAGEHLPPLAGIPVAVKDNICTAGVRTTCASKMLHNFIPPYNATVVDKLNQSRLVMVGKTNLDEFAMGSTNENSAFYPTRNPWDTTRVPGGSSGGSAAAVAAGEAILALGSDTGGSVRLPASYCGVVGLKPTYGLVSRYGVVGYAPSLDHVGFLTRDVRDSALILSALAGHDPRDATSVNREGADYTSYLTGDIKGVKIGVPREYLNQDVDAGVQKAIQDAINVLVDLGAGVEEVSLPHAEYALPAYYIIAQAEASSNLSKFDGVRYGYRDEEAADLTAMYAATRGRGFGSEVKRRIMFGTYVLSADQYKSYLEQAQKVRTLIRQDFQSLFTRYQLLLGPTVGSVAPKTGDQALGCEDAYHQDFHTLSANLAGLPAISIPAGMVDGLPVGLQLIGQPLGDGELLGVAYALEQNTAQVPFPGID